MGGPNLEVFKFGMYVMFPIGWMYYFGTNLDNRFTIPNFWPTPEESNKLPYEKEDILAEYERLKQQRIELRKQKLQLEAFRAAQQQNEESPES